MLEEKVEPVVADFCPKASSISMTMHDHTLLLQQLPPSIPLTVHTSLHPTVMCLARLRKRLRGRRFQSDGEVKETAHFWLRQRAKPFFSTGIQKLAERCEKSITKDGD
jgi:hypothetical protein